MERFVDGILLRVDLELVEYRLFKGCGNTLRTRLYVGVGGLRLRQYLEILLNALSATSLARIDYVVDRGVIVIATEDALPKSRHVTRVYDVTELLAPPSRPFFFDVPMFPVMMYGGIPRRPLGTLGPLGAARGRPRSRNVYPRSGLRR